MKIKKYQIFLSILLSAFFVFFSSYALSIEKEWVLLIPPALLCGISFLFNIDKFLWFIVFFTPLSISISELGFFFENINFSFPTEFLLFGLLFVLIIHMFFYFKDFSLALGQTDRIPLIVSVWVPVIVLSLFAFIGVIQINEK